MPTDLQPLRSTDLEACSHRPAASWPAGSAGVGAAPHSVRSTTDGPQLRHPGSNLPTTGHKGNEHYRGKALSGLSGSPRQSCMGCNDFRPQEGGKGKGVHWRCAVCLAAKASTQEES